MKTRLLALLLVLAPSMPAAGPPAFDPALENRSWLLEVLRYSYYWYLDDAFFAATQAETEITVWLRAVEPHRRDADDQSKFAELWLPQAKILLSLKQADYRIEELNLAVKSAGYRVVRGGYEATPPGAAADWKKLSLPRDGVMAELKATRGNLHLPRPATKELALAAVRKELARLGGITGPQKLFIAARTDVTTDVWVFWEDQRTIFRISGDMDAVDPELRAQFPLLVRRYPLGDNVVASYLEAEGKNSLLSRDLASRVLFVCVARGEAVVLEPAGK